MKKKRRVNVLKTTKKLRSKLWPLVSEYVRRSATDYRGYAQCYTCSATLYWKLGHCAHFEHGTLDYDLRNLKFCCVRCNKYLRGNLGAYAIRLIKEKGLKWVEQLKKDAVRNRGYVYKIAELEELIEKFKGLLKTLD